MGYTDAFKSSINFQSMYLKEEEKSIQGVVSKRRRSSSVRRHKVKKLLGFGRGGLDSSQSIDEMELWL